VRSCPSRLRRTDRGERHSVAELPTIRSVWETTIGLSLAADEVYSVFLKPLTAEAHRENCTTRGSFRPHRCVWIGAQTGLNLGDNVRDNGRYWVQSGHGLLQSKCPLMTRTGLANGSGEINSGPK
jgi:hypothetical protein